MTEWKKGDRAMVVIDGFTTGGLYCTLKGDEARAFVDARALHPLPPHVAASDAALADATEEEAKRAGRLWLEGNDGHVASMRVALNDFISRRRAAMQASPTLSPEDAAVIEAAEKQEARGGQFARAKPGEAERMAEHAYRVSCSDTNAAIRARRAAIPKTTREEPAQVPAVETFVSPEDQSPAEQIHLALKYARDALAHWGEGAFGLSMMDNAIRLTAPVPAAPARAFKVGDRVRCKVDGRIGKIVQSFRETAEWVRWDDGDLRIEPTDQLDLIPAPDLSALERVVVHYALAQQQIGHQPISEEGKVEYDAACARTNASAAALRAAREPVVERDAVGEAEAAFDELDKELRSAPGAAMDRLRAALARLRETGR